MLEDQPRFTRPCPLDHGHIGAIVLAALDHETLHGVVLKHPHEFRKAGRPCITLTHTLLRRGDEHHRGYWHLGDLDKNVPSTLRGLVVEVDASARLGETVQFKAHRGERSSLDEHAAERRAPTAHRLVNKRIGRTDPSAHLDSPGLSGGLHSIES